MAREKPDELSIEERLLAIQERQLAIQEQQLKNQEVATRVQAAQLEQTKKKSHAQNHGISAFNPRGEREYPMPKLKCVLFAPWSCEPESHSLTREEVELVNLLEPCTTRLELTDGSTIIAAVVGTRNSVTDKLEKLDLRGAYDPALQMHGALFTEENKQLFPSLANILRQILGDKAAGVMPMREEARRIKLPESDPQHLPVSVGA